MFIIRKNKISTWKCCNYVSTLLYNSC